MKDPKERDLFAGFRIVMMPSLAYLFLLLGLSPNISVSGCSKVSVRPGRT